MTRAESVHSTPRKTAFKIVAGTDFDPVKPQTKSEEIDRIATEAPTVSPDGEVLSELFSKTYWMLPFVTLPTEDFDSWGEFWEQVIMWNDERTDAAHVDYHRGRRYAHLAIEAIRKDNTCQRQLEITVDRMIEGAFRRRGPSGKLCRGLSSSEHGFLNALCSAAVWPNALKAEAKRRGWQ